MTELVNQLVEEISNMPRAYYAVKIYACFISESNYVIDKLLNTEHFINEESANNLKSLVEKKAIDEGLSISTINPSTREGNPRTHYLKVEIEKKILKNNNKDEGKDKNLQELIGLTRDIVYGNGIPMERIAIRGKK